MAAAGGQQAAISFEEFDRSMQEARTQMKVINSSLKSCYPKCIGRYNEGELTVGESACLERCAFKYFEVMKMVARRSQPGAGSS